MKTPVEEGRYTVVYDGLCVLCRRAVQRLASWDPEGILIFLRAQDPEVRERFPSLSLPALQDSIHLIAPDGRIWTGAEAVEQLARVLPGWKGTAWLFRLPFVRPLARLVYRWVARNRFRFFCDEHCDSG